MTMQVDKARLDEMLATADGACSVNIGDWSYKDPTVDFETIRSIITELLELRSLRSTEGKEDECDPDGCKVHIEAFMNRAEAAEAHVAKLREALEGIDKLVTENVHDNGAEVDRMKINGEWHTGPVVDASFRILRGFQKIARAALTRSPE